MYVYIYISFTLGIFSFESIHEKFSKLAPCVLVLNNGSDPAKELIKLAEKNDITGPAFKALSLGICEEHVSDTGLRTPVGELRGRVLFRRSIRLCTRRWTVAIG